jgi:hypothetical protein
MVSNEIKYINKLSILLTNMVLAGHPYGKIAMWNSNKYTDADLIALFKKMMDRPDMVANLEKLCDLHNDSIDRPYFASIMRHEGMDVGGKCGEALDTFMTEMISVVGGREGEGEGEGE